MKNIRLNGKLNIAMLGQKRIPSREGGVEIVVEELATRMAAMGHFVTCYNRRGHHVSGREFDDAALSEYKGVRLITVCTVDKKGLAAMSSSFFAAVKSAFGRYDVGAFPRRGSLRHAVAAQVVWKTVYCYHSRCCSDNRDTISGME